MRNALGRYFSLMMVRSNKFGVLASLDSENSAEMLDDMEGLSRGPLNQSDHQTLAGRNLVKVEPIYEKKVRKVAFLLPDDSVKDLDVATPVNVETDSDDTEYEDEESDGNVENNEGDDKEESEGSSEEEERATFESEASGDVSDTQVATRSQTPIGTGRVAYEILSAKSASTGEAEKGEDEFLLEDEDEDKDEMEVESDNEVELDHEKAEDTNV
ncbi:hypothetical protein U1Q18_040403 [Sarracenia purpurea var. burkii]